jgi:thiamine kinase-like enzyme
MGGISEDLAAALRRIPMLAGRDPAAIAAERLGGLTNQNWRIDAGGDSFVLRIPGAGTEAYIDRRVEAANARIAAAAGVNAEIVFFDESDGLQLARYLPDVATMNAERFRDLGAVGRAAEAFARIHCCGRSFANRFELFAKMDEYLAYLREKRARIPKGYDRVQQEAEAVRAALALHPAPLVPCHCDPLAENFLDTGTRIWIVDWEYSGNNDPMWDLGDLSVEAGFGPAQDEALMAAYFASRPPADQLGRMVMYKAMCDLLWTLWGVIQVVNENPVENFWAYAVNRFERCQALMATPEFGRHLAAVRAG